MRLDLRGAATAERLPLVDSSFDLVLAFAVLPMVRQKSEALLELRRVLKPGGLLAVSEEIIEPEYVPAMLTKRWCRRLSARQSRYCPGRAG